jgi:hypothetical protein
VGGRGLLAHDQATRLSEVVGRTPGEALQGPDTSFEARERMRDAIRAREPFRTTVLDYARWGRRYWVDVETRPLLARARRAHPGGCPFQNDVTEARIAESREALMRRVAALLLASTSVESAAPRGSSGSSCASST